MSCFENYIGIKSCELTTPKSGKFLEDIGISISKLAHIADESNLTGVKFGTDKINEAINYVLADVMLEYSQTPFSDTINAYGINEVDYYGSIIIKSTCKDLAVRLDNIRFNVVEDIDTILYVKDGSTITQYNVNTADELNINYVAKNKKVELYINDINYMPIEYFGQCGGCNDYSLSIGQTGIEVDYSMTCDLSCRLMNDNNFKNAVLYYSGILISQYTRFSGNTNEVVRFANDEDEITREDVWMAMYEKYAEKVRMSFYDIIEDSCCKKCDKYKVTYKF